ncbi:MAG: HAMP domain-containing histidine kinase [Lachnospiraceae bacterium]|nr:HAMP domain-containing histidine kinase [Lachnospiraceae bacterium]
MDTKSKNSETKKRNRQERMPGVFVAAVLILSASLTFLSQYPGFKERATADEPNILAGSEFLHEIYQANMVLYKQICDWKAEGKEMTAQDFFLSGKIKKAELEDYNEYYSFDESPLSFAGEQIDELLYQWDLSFHNGLEQQIDYEIMDRESGRTFANTERALHYLGTEEESIYLDNYYPYYIKLDFDENGVLEHVWVRGGDVDTLVENVQRVMRSRYLERSLYESLSYSAYGGINWENAIYYESRDDNAVMQIELQVLNMPKNCTVCYALTEAQLADVKASSRMYLSMSTAGNYRTSGIQDVFNLLLVVLGITAMLLPFWKKYRLHAYNLLPLHIEVLTVLVFATFLILGELSATLVMYSVSDSWEYSLPYILSSAFPGLTAMMGARTIVLVINLLFLTMAFTLWFTLITAYAQVYVFGIRGYMRKRCLCYRVFRCMRVSIRRKRARIKREFLYMDLEQNLNVPLFQLLLANFVILAVISFFWLFGVVLLIPYTIFLYGLLRKYIRIIQDRYGEMLKAAHSVADGNLQTEIAGDWGMFSAFQEELAAIQSGFSSAVEEEVKSQRMRTELITNVSHDLKTPLTAIITYTELLREEGVTESQRKEYLAVLHRKSLRLKTLIEDLFEVSKANSGNVAFDTEKVDICHLVRQMYLEYEDKAAKAGLVFRFRFPEQKVFLMLDSDKTSRIFDNLYANIIKYAMPDTRVYVSVESRDGEVGIELKNISGYELNIPAESLTERFVRGDSARNSEGSGLGLAIARSFVELQGGKMEIEIDGDLFKVYLFWKEL